MTEVVTEQSATPSFLEMSKLGRHAWWQYLAGFVIILVGYIVIGGAVYWIPASLALHGQKPQLDPNTGLIANLDPTINYVALNATFVVLLLLIIFVVKVVNNRPVTSLISPVQKVRFDRMWLGFGGWLLLTALISIVQYFIWPASFKVSFSAQQFLALAPIILLMTPVQAATEELLFRGYLLQGFAFVKNIWVMSVLNGIFFLIPHLSNPEMSADPVLMGMEYFAIGFIFAIITLKTNGLEFAIGAHAANNLFSALICNYSKSVLTTPSIFINTEMRPFYDLITLVIAGFAFIWLATQYIRRKENPPLAR